MESTVCGDDDKYNTIFFSIFLYKKLPKSRFFFNFFSLLLSSFLPFFFTLSSLKTHITEILKSNSQSHSNRLVSYH